MNFQLFFVFLGSTHPTDSINTWFLCSSINGWVVLKTKQKREKIVIFAFQFCIQYYSTIYWWIMINHISMESVGWVLPKKAKKVENSLWRHRGIPQKSSKFFSEKVVTKNLITVSNFGLDTWNFFYKLSRCMPPLNREPIFEFLSRGHFMGVQSQNTPFFNFGPSWNDP